MNEIEVKARLKDAKHGKDIIRKLKKAGWNFGATLKQKDTIYCDKETLKRFDQFTPVPFSRIRIQGKMAWFTLKKSEINELEGIECETEISDPKAMHEALLQLGQFPGTIVEKKRIKAKKGKLEVCIDEVKGLGWFVEVEKLTNEKDSEKVQSELFDFLKTFGIEVEDRVANGYDTLIYRKFGPLKA